MKINWILIALFSGIVGGGITYGLTRNWKLSLISSVFILVLVLINNPKRRYIKAFWVILSMILVLNKLFFEVIGSISDIHFKIGSSKLDASVTVALIILAGLCLLLDYLQRNGKLKGTFFEINKNINKNVSGTNIHINQNIKNTSKND